MISIIIPIYNEEKTIISLLRNINTIKNKAEIIFVDGGSKDDTLNLIPKSYKVYKSSKGRAAQMNYGASKARGAILLFLHADSKLPKQALAQMINVMRTYEVGCFGIKFADRSPLMKCCEVISNHRIKDRKVMFGDQGIFIRRELFEAMGGFKEIPIMEDYEFSLRLKEMGIRIGRTRSKILTSERRFEKGKRLWIMWKMNRLRAMYRQGVDINIISNMYRDIR